MKRWREKWNDGGRSETIGGRIETMEGEVER
ncbi:hypothetical protein J2S05_003238 [Alkalicoccobacillus murimartini]|uniref:Uncharacterized protein n=1 Tax=Alkalicoccobacillus murimartini TaxID=171685 RepID=A0ABT9YKN2_9BACI|nr:hypothetical protein [Alkalicoccobacillus murimartini]